MRNKGNLFRFAQKQVKLKIERFLKFGEWSLEFGVKESFSLCEKMKYYNYIIIK